MIEITRYPVRNETLSPWVKFIWKLESADKALHFKLLPTAFIDVILNRGSAVVYEAGARRIEAPPFHINGLRQKYSFIHQEKGVCLYGISFYAHGFYPFSVRPMGGMQNDIFDLAAFAPGLAQRMSLVLQESAEDRIIAGIERSLLAELKIDAETAKWAGLVRHFAEESHEVSVKDYCEERSVNIRAFERATLRITGFTPKALRSVGRFQAAGNQLVHERGFSLAELAYENSFSDQAHFTNEFRRFSGAAPRRFLAEGKSVKEHAKYKYD